MSTDHHFNATKDRSPQRPSDGVLRVPRDVLAECLKHYTQAELNGFSWERRLEIADEAVRAIEARKRAGAGNDAAAALRAERARRKTEAWAKRQPKTHGQSDTP